MDTHSRRELIGLVPAGGMANRVSPLPCSKEIFPLGNHYPSHTSGPRPKVAAHYLLEKMKSAGAQKAFIILRSGKWDIPAYFGCGRSIGMNLAYLMMDLPYGAPYTLDQSFAFVSHASVLFGFPDILFTPTNAFSILVERLSDSGADIVLGLYRASNPAKMDMVELDNSGKIRNLVIKPLKSALMYTWIIAAWTPEFTRYLHNYIAVRKDLNDAADRPETYVGDVIQSAIEDGLKIDSVLFDGEDYLDIGTPEDLAKAHTFAANFS